MSAGGRMETNNETASDSIVRADLVQRNIIHVNDQKYRALVKKRSFKSDVPFCNNISFSDSSTGMNNKEPIFIMSLL